MLEISCYGELLLAIIYGTIANMPTATRFRGDLLRSVRKARKLSQSQLGSRISAHVTSISDWETGKNAPSGRHVAGLCRELGITAEQLYGDEDEEESDMYAQLVSDLRRIARVEAESVVAEHEAAAR